MSAVDNPHDREEAVRARSAQEDPWVMYLVVRRERLGSFGETLASAAVAAVDCVDRLRDHPTWRAPFDAWLARSFRKVCLRANERDWARLDAYDRGEAMVRGLPAARALPPRTKSQRDKLITHLQALTSAEFAAPVFDEPGFAMRLVMRDGLQMSAGKAIAQVAHASVHACAAFGAASPDDFARWRAAGMPCDVRAASDSDWEALKRDERVVVVRDAGLTEVAPGSETFLAMAPTEAARWSARYRGLSRL